MDMTNMVHIVLGESGHAEEDILGKVGSWKG